MTSEIPEEVYFKVAERGWRRAADDPQADVGGSVGAMKRVADEALAAKVDDDAAWGPQGYLNENTDVVKGYEVFREQLQKLSKAAATQFTETADLIAEANRGYRRTEGENTDKSRGMGR